MSPFVAALATLAIFFASGALLVALLGQRIRLSLAEQLYITVAGSVVVSGWMGLLLAELGYNTGQIASMIGDGAFGHVGAGASP